MCMSQFLHLSLLVQKEMGRRGKDITKAGVMIVHITLTLPLRCVFVVCMGVTRTLGKIYPDQHTHQLIDPSICYHQ